MATKKINGKDYDLQKTDWQAEINKAKSTGDYKLAAQFEQARNEKINSSAYKASGGKQTTTNNYAGWLDGKDYAQQGIDQMASGASWQDVLDTYNNRLNKASSTIGMEKYTNDEHQQAMMDYILANMNIPEEPQFNFDYSGSSRPTFNSNYYSQMDAKLNEILSRDDFSYNVEADPLYQQYLSQYQREGNRAMNDTMAAAAANAGGMNSYAITAANQANNYHMAQLGDKIPELYQLAYDMYLQDKASDVEDLGLLQQMDDTQYNRYRDTMRDWENDRDFAYGQYRDQVGDYQWNQSFDYSAERDAIADSQWQQQFDYNKYLDSVENGQWQQQFDYNVGRDTVSDKRYDQQWDYETDNDAYAKALELLNAGVMPDATMLAQAGLSNSKAAEILKAVQAGNTGGGYNNGSRTPEQVKEMQDHYGVTADGKWGSNSKDAADGMDADAAWDAYQKSKGDPYADTRNNATSAQNKVDGTKLSEGALKKLNSLKLMQGSIGSQQGIGNSIAVYADTGEITMEEAEYMFRYFGYDPDEWIDY